jgi:hypothetical protein
MAKENGGVIGIINTPTSTTASGVWALQDQYEAKRNSNWPLTPFVSPYSARFNSGSSDYLSKTSFGTATNRKIFTLSFWVKKTTNGDKLLFSAGTNASTNVDQIYFRYPSDVTENTFDVNFYESSTTVLQLRTTQYFRDPSAWYHFIVAIDSTQATASNRAKVYLNGTQITSFSTATYPSQNAEFLINSTNAHYIAGNLGASATLDGYLSEFYFIDGQALTPSSFGASNASGVWYPIPYTGSYGTNGFYLKFGNASSLGTDSSPNGNNFTVNNLTSVDQSTDSTLNNFATLNSILYSTSISLTEGNLKFTNSSAGSQRMVASTIAPTNGKWYAECRVTSLGGAYPQIGVLDTSIYTFDTYVGALVRGYGYASHGQVYNNAGALTTGLATYTTNDIIGVALDLDNNYVYFSKNGTFINSGVPTSGSSGTGGWAITNGYDYSFGSSSLDSGTDPVFDWNFGSPFYSANSYADGNGYGNFSYAVPSGYYALCTANLNTYG